MSRDFLNILQGSAAACCEALAKLDMCQIVVWMIRPYAEATQMSGPKIRPSVRKTIVCPDPNQADYSPSNHHFCLDPNQACIPIVRGSCVHLPLAAESHENAAELRTAAGITHTSSRNRSMSRARCTFLLGTCDAITSHNYIV